MQGFDVGGSHKSQQSGYEVFGVQNQARVISDGVDHTEGVGGTGFYEDYFANEEVSVSALGADVEMNSPGAAIVTTIKSGGNMFKGLEHLSYEPGKFVGTNGGASDISSRGYTCPTNSAGTPQCANPVLLFWETHLDLGGPIAKDKAWFYGAYNHFKIDKVVSGVPQDVATDIGIFDNETGKATWKPSQRSTFVGYFQQGRKQKPKRGLSTLLPPESVRAQDSYSRMYKGEWQFVASDRAFLNVNAGNFTLDWPMVVQVDPTVRPPLQYRATTAVAGAGWNAFTTGRKKPQVKAQLTYYVPSKAGSHDFKFGFEDIYDWYRLGIKGTSGPVRYSVNANGVIDRVRFVDTGAPGDFERGWNASPNYDQHYAGYLQDRWTPNNRLSITAGVRIDYQDVGYLEGHRHPSITDVTGFTADGGRIFPVDTVVPRKSLVTNTNVAPRIGVSYNLTGKGNSVLKAFYGRFYNNIADGFSAANPGGANYVDYNFNDLNHNGRYDGPQELVSFRTRLGGADAPVNPNLKTPYTDEISGTYEHQFWGESSARLTYVRKHQAQYLPFYFTPLIPAWMGRVTVPTRVTNGRETYNLLDVPDSLADSTSGLYDNWPDGTFDYDTVEVAFRHRFSSKFFIESSFDHIWRNELRSADIGDWGSNSPLSTDPIGVGPQLTPNPAAPNRQKTTMFHAQILGRYTFPYDVGLAVNYRLQSGFPYSRIIDGGNTDQGLNLCNFECSFFVQNLDQNRSEAVNLMNLRIDKSFPMANKTKFSVIFDAYNLLNADPVTNFNLYSDDFKRVIAVLDPRVFQLGFRLEF
jgi:hypothetical protein